MPRESQLHRFSIVVNDINPKVPPEPINDALMAVGGGEQKCKFAWQFEQGSNAGKDHLQGCLQLKGGSFNKKRPKQVVNLLFTLLKAVWPELTKAQITVSQAHDIEALWAYCTDPKKRKSGTCPTQTHPYEYMGWDLECIVNNPYPYQKHLEYLVRGRADDRKILWLVDEDGCNGKSKWTKYMCFYKHAIKLPVGKAHQLRAISAEIINKLGDDPNRVWIVDIPRSIGKDDSVVDIISALEDLKNGHVVNAMYGKNMTGICSPAHVVVFSNFRMPWKAMTPDRWMPLFIDKSTKMLYTGFRPHEAPVADEAYDEIGWRALTPPPEPAVSGSATASAGAGGAGGPAILEEPPLTGDLNPILGIQGGITNPHKPGEIKAAKMLAKFSEEFPEEDESLPETMPWSNGGGAGAGAGARYVESDAESVYSSSSDEVSASDVDDSNSDDDFESSPPTAKRGRRGE